ncbi:MAG: hypothetical protein Q8O38_08350 [Sulfurimicrobium sp.]|nr:hypothetical protein [Sulfurimicrobium sp.]
MEENDVNASITSSTDNLSEAHSPKVLRNESAKLRKAREDTEKARKNLELLVAQEKAIEKEDKTKELEIQKEMEKSVNQHLAILARLEGIDFRTPDGRLNSRRNNLNEALIAGCFAQIKTEVDNRPGFAAQLEEEGRKVLAERARKFVKNIKPAPKTTSPS